VQEEDCLGGRSSETQVRRQRRRRQERHAFT
jgi:hypothetical protein